jgi:hypothetical protein
MVMEYDWTEEDIENCELNDREAEYVRGSSSYKELKRESLDVKDNVNNPSHYNQAGVECIDAIKASLGDEYPDYCKGNVMKYLWRYKYKNGIEDLKKAQWYLNSMVESVEND